MDAGAVDRVERRAATRRSEYTTPMRPSDVNACMNRLPGWGLGCPNTAAAPATERVGTECSRIFGDLSNYKVTILLAKYGL